MNMIPFVLWMLLFIPLQMIAEYFSVKAGHEKMDENAGNTIGCFYLIVGVLLFLFGLT